MGDLLWWGIAIVGGAIFAGILVGIVRKIVFKQEKVEFHLLSAVGVALTVIGIAFVKNFNRIMKLFGIKIPIDSEPIKPDELDKIVQADREKAKQEATNALNKKTPDEIIDTVLPADAHAGVDTAIANGQKRIDDLFDRTRMDGTSGGDQKNP